jgi:hypothetical protein
MNNNQNCDNYLSAIINSETNSRIYDRNVPSQVLQPYFTPRSVSTKYSILPIVDPRRENALQVMSYPTYNTRTIFNPGNSQSPWSGYSSNINKESELRNQIFALQKCSQSVYVPDSTSDLYQYDFQATQNSHQPFNELFREEKFDAFNPNPENLSTGLFQNCTRNSIKDLTQETAIQPNQTMQQQQQQQVKPNQQQYQQQYQQHKQSQQNASNYKK